jgi:signal transduction histidine kinase
MGSDSRDGTGYIGNVPQGTHLCEFHSTSDELTHTLVPYFSAGLQRDELCVWVTSDPAGVDETETKLRKIAPQLGRYVDSGQIEILDGRDWYLRGGHFDGDRVLGQWSDKEQQCLDSGYKGLRVTGDMAWLQKRDWPDFMAYEAEVDRVLPKRRVTGLCAYSLDTCTADEVMDVVSNHQCAIGLPAETSESEQLQRLSALVLERHDEDRRWIAGQLHEVTAQNVVAIRVYLSSLQKRAAWPSEIQSLLAHCHSLCEQSLEQILTLSNLLHPPILDQLGLAACLRQYILDFRKRSGIHVDFEPLSEIGRLPQEMETHLFRVVQEGLANISRHSGSLMAIVRLERQGDQLLLQIEDLGGGTTGPGTQEAGLGILAMQERLQKIGGCLEIRSSNRSTILTASVSPPGFQRKTAESLK